MLSSSEEHLINLLRSGKTLSLGALRAPKASFNSGEFIDALIFLIEELNFKIVDLTAENLRLKNVIKDRDGEKAERSIPSSGNISLTEISSLPIQKPSRGIVEEAVRYARLTDLQAIAEEDDDEIEEELIEASSTGSGFANIATPPTIPSQYRAMTQQNIPDLTGLITRENEYPASGGGYADVYIGVLALDSPNESQQKVAVKVIRSHIYNEANRWKIDKRIQRETRIWGCLDHPNILPLLGITFDFGNHMAMVCPWMEGGDLNTYLREFKKTLTLSKRLDLLSGVVEGLSYLHSQSVVHGDLTTGNILISQERAILSDFGLSTVVAECQGTSFMSSTVGGAVRWAAPELYEVGIHSEITPIITKSCDIYSLGNVMLQTISGRIPFDHLSTDLLVVMELIKGGHSRRPPETMLTDELWDLIMRCWGTDMFSRLDVRGARALLHECRAACPLELLTRTLANADDDSENNIVVSGR